MPAINAKYPQLRPITSDDDKTIDTVALNLGKRLGATLRRGELEAARAAEHRAALLDDAAD
jgi:hypothetical protein